MPNIFFGSWKSIDTAPRGPIEAENHVCIHGTAYWISKWRPFNNNHILALDWEEKISIIKLPKENIPRGPCFLIDLDGGLCVVIVSANCWFQIWVFTAKLCWCYVLSKEKKTDHGIFSGRRKGGIVYQRSLLRITWT